MHLQLLKKDMHDAGQHYKTTVILSLSSSEERLRTENSMHVQLNIAAFKYRDINLILSSLIIKHPVKLHVLKIR